MRLNTAIKGVKASATLAINQAVKTMRAAGVDVVHWGFGESPFAVPKEVVSALKDGAGLKSYLPGEGLGELREAVSRYYQSQFQYTIQWQDVFIAPGSKEAIFQLLYLLDGPLLLPQPSWVSYEPQARLLNKEVIGITTHYDNQFFITAEGLERALQGLAKDSQKILILNSPNNPTGLVCSQAQLNDLKTVIDEHNLIVISDEIYAGVYFNDTSHTSPYYVAPERTIVTGGISKLFSAGGYRLGVALIPPMLKDLKTALKVLISETYSCVSYPIQMAALSAYRDIDLLQPYLSQCTKVHELAGTYLATQFKELGLACHLPQGAFYLLPSFKPFTDKLKAKGIDDDVALCHYLLKHHQLALLPGSDFGLDTKDYFVRVATVDYEGEKALQAESIEDEVFRHIRLGVDKLRAFLS